MWEIERTDEIAEWISSLDDDAKESIFRDLMILKTIGPSLGRPYVDTVKNSKFTNMKELRVQSKFKVLRLFFAFDPERKAIMLIGGDKKGDKRFYEKMISIADALYEKHVKQLRLAHENKRKK